MSRSKGSIEQKKVNPLTQFSGYYQFLSIDYPSWVYYEGFMYPSITMAFQAARTNDSSLRRKISQLKDQTSFRQLIQEIKSAPDWNQRRLTVMTQLNRDKFKRNKQLGMKLFATQSRQLMNCYTKGGDAEAFWGMIPRNNQLEGLNALGNILTEVREELKNCTDSRKWVENQRVEKDPSLWPDASIVVQKEGDQVDNLLLKQRGTFLLGSHQLADFKLEHGSISKFHASVYFSSDMQVIIVDLNSTNGTVIIRRGQEIKLSALRPESLEDRDMIRFGQSSRKYTCYFSYQQVETRIRQKQQEMKDQLVRIERIKYIEKNTADNQIRNRQEIKSLLELKEYQCLYVEGVTREWSYQNIKDIFLQFGLVKNVRSSINQKTGRFMGSVLVYYQNSVKINTVLQNIANAQRPLPFRVKAVSTQQAEDIIATFSKTGSEVQKKKVEVEDRRRGQENKRKDRWVDRSRSRQRQQRNSKVSSSSDSSSTPQPKRKRDKKYR